MGLYRVTFTGADDRISPRVLIELAKANQIIEWGILYSISRQGIGRYPSLAWIDALCREISANNLHRQFALHVFGTAVEHLIHSQGHVNEVVKFFGRVQLNVRPGRFDPYLIRECISSRPGQTFITQQNNGNASLTDLLAGLKNHAVLFDASGGQGISPAVWPAPLKGSSCGYAGGLGHGNLAEELPKIQAAAGDAVYWIDMEGRLRDEEDQFDIMRVNACLQEVLAFRNAPASSMATSA